MTHVLKNQEEKKRTAELEKDSCAFAILSICCRHHVHTSSLLDHGEVDEDDIDRFVVPRGTFTPRTNVIPVVHSFC